MSHLMKIYGEEHILIEEKLGLKVTLKNKI